MSGIKRTIRRKKYKISPRKAQLKFIYQKLIKLKKIETNFWFEKFCIVKDIRSLSGVLVITIFTSAYPKVGKKIQKFSCKHNCYYCPDEPELPRSYLSEEPGVARGKRHKWKSIDQFYSRAWTHKINGHPIDKIEVLILGGTWSEYPREYQYEFIRDIFWSANTFYDNPPKRGKLRLEEEHSLNENAEVRIIGLTLETRPDSITLEELKKMRLYGCTRIQLGIQHTNNSILKKIYRDSYRDDAVNATQLCKDVGFKIDYHLMPDLPGTTSEIDMEMFKDVIFSENLQADQWKIYPCEVIPWTIIKKWFDEGIYIPYQEELLFELILKVKIIIHPWIRINRVIRDIPNHYIIGGNDITNLRQNLHQKLKKRNLLCHCIRCREIGRCNIKQKVAILKERKYISSGGFEYFLSFETYDREKIFGFLRLRLSNNSGLNGTFPELTESGLIRELHVYGRLRKVKEKSFKKGETQHYGFGKQLMKRAEKIAINNGYYRIAVIAGIGARKYYKSLGYSLKGTFMVKNLLPSVSSLIGVICLTIFVLKCVWERKINIKSRYFFH